MCPHVTVLVSATKAKSRIPYKYHYFNTVIYRWHSNGNGIFEGVQNIDIQFMATDDKGDSNPVIEARGGD